MIDTGILMRAKRKLGQQVFQGKWMGSAFGSCN
jgi:hypothetical protein